MSLKTILETLRRMSRNTETARCLKRSSLMPILYYTLSPAYGISNFQRNSKMQNILDARTVLLTETVKNRNIMLPHSAVGNLSFQVSGKVCSSLLLICEYLRMAMRKRLYISKERTREHW